MNIKSKLAHALFTARERNGLTQLEVAQLANISPQWYQRLEGGRGCPSYPLGLELMVILDIRVEDVLQKAVDYAAV